MCVFRCSHAGNHRETHLQTTRNQPNVPFLPNDSHWHQEQRSRHRTDTRIAATGKDDQPTLYKPEFEHDACGIGALASIKGERSHQILDDALSVLVNLEHRGGVGLERNTGDGAGILFQVPHRFFRKEAQKCGHLLPHKGDYGVAMVFLPRDEHGVVDARRIFEEECAACGIPLLFWRTVPVDPHDLGSTRRETCMPTIMQAFLGTPRLDRGR